MQLTGIIEKADVDVKIDVQRGRWSPAKEAEKEKEARTKEKVLLTSGCFEMAAQPSLLPAAPRDVAWPPRQREREFTKMFSSCKRRARSKSSYI
jgi:hypothetical protein